MPSVFYKTGGAYIIAMIGTEFTGKTELIDELKEHIYLRLKDQGLKRDNIGVLPEVVRKCPYPAQLNSTLRSQQWILDTQLEDILKAGSKHKVLILDRTFLDNVYGYWWFACQKHNKELDSKDQLSEEEIQFHLRRWGIEMTMAYTDFIYYVHKFPATKELMEDGVRSANIEFRDSADDRIQVGVDQLRLVTYDPPVLDLFSEIKNIPSTKKQAEKAQVSVQLEAMVLADQWIVPRLLNYVRKN